jgi:hypothetical protein
MLLISASKNAFSFQQLFSSTKEITLHALITLAAIRESQHAGLFHERRMITDPLLVIVTVFCQLLQGIMLLERSKAAVPSSMAADGDLMIPLSLLQSLTCSAHLHNPSHPWMLMISALHSCRMEVGENMSSAMAYSVDV